jgi:hypothetical protein
VRTFSRQALADAIVEPGIGPVRARDLLEAIRDDLVGMTQWLVSPAGQGADEASWLAAFPSIRGALGAQVSDEVTARAVMRLVATMGDGEVIG